MSVPQMLGGLGSSVFIVGAAFQHHTLGGSHGRAFRKLRSHWGGVADSPTTRPWGTVSPPPPALRAQTQGLSPARGRSCPAPSQKALGLLWIKSFWDGKSLDEFPPSLSWEWRTDLHPQEGGPASAGRVEGGAPRLGEARAAA